MEERPYFTDDLEELSLIENGAKILFATDDFFAVAENLLKREEPISNDEYTEFGKWMDGWETRRKRISGHDWAIIQLIGGCEIYKVCVDTAHFTGNFAPRFSIQGALMDHPVTIQKRINKIGTGATIQDFKNVSKLESENWKHIIPMTTLKDGNPGNSKHYFEINVDHIISHLRFNIFPDGGIARVRIYGKRVAAEILSNACFDSHCIQAKCIYFSNAHYGHPDNLMKPWSSKGMYDGWETARKLDRPPVITLDNSGFIQAYGEEWAIFKLEKTVILNCIQVDTTHFKGNCPDSVQIDVSLTSAENDINYMTWQTILHRTKLSPDERKNLTSPLLKSIQKPINLVKLIIIPDGGIARLRLYGMEVKQNLYKHSF